MSGGGFVIRGGGVAEFVEMPLGRSQCIWGHQERTSGARSIGRVEGGVEEGWTGAGGVQWAGGGAGVFRGRGAW